MTHDEQKAVELDILRAVDTFCRKQNLSYMLNSGTLLGAVRHKGFIPWDDDIDIMMPRPDYERFYHLFNKAFQQGATGSLRITSYRDKSSIYPFLKVVDTRTLVMEKYVDPHYAKSGVWIDIFPIDGVLDEDDVFVCNERVKRRYDIVVANVHEGTTRVRRIAKRVLKPLFARNDIYELARSLDERCARTPIQPGRDVAKVFWGVGERNRMPYELLERIEMEFEGEMRFVPRIYDYMLTSLYGDYMQLPPEDKRVGHFVDAYWVEGDSY